MFFLSNLFGPPLKRFNHQTVCSASGAPARQQECKSGNDPGFDWLGAVLCDMETKYFLWYHGCPLLIPRVGTVHWITESTSLARCLKANARWHWPSSVTPAGICGSSLSAAPTRHNCGYS